MQRVQGVWGGFGAPVIVPDHYRPLEDMVDPLLGAGFLLEKIVETKPVAALRERDPFNFERYSRRPSFLCFSAYTPRP